VAGAEVISTVLEAVSMVLEVATMAPCAEITTVAVCEAREEVVSLTTLVVSTTAVIWNTQVALVEAALPTSIMIVSLKTMAWTVVNNAACVAVVIPMVCKVIALVVSTVVHLVMEDMAVRECQEKSAANIITEAKCKMTMPVECPLRSLKGSTCVGLVVVETCACAVVAVEAPLQRCVATTTVNSAEEWAAVSVPSK